jgi:GNAT superfamily N-acetyltransferase
VLHAPNPFNSRSPLPEYVGATLDCSPHWCSPATRPHITRLGCEHEAQLAALLCGFDSSARINRFGHPASNACVRGYATDTLARAEHIVGALDAGRLIGVAELFAARRGVAELAFAIDAEWRRRGVAWALLEVAKRWAEQAGVATLRMVISRNNWPMRQFAHKAGARLDLCLDEVFADIAVPTTASLDISA